MTQSQPSSALDPASRVARADGLLHTELEGQTVLLNVDTGTYHGLDEVATRIWEILQAPTTLSVLVDQLATEFEVERPQCLADVSRFVEKMSEAKLLVVESPATNSSQDTAD
jgi:hypothetical protein